MSKICLYCKKAFEKKTVFGSCADCKTCPDICDNCQTIVNQQQEKIKQKILKEKKGLELPVKSLIFEVSKQHPFLLRQTFETLNTQKKMSIYSYWKVVDGINLMCRPRNQKEEKEIGKWIENTTEWIDISKQIQESHFIDLCRPEVEEEVCSECEKGKQVIEVPFGTKQKPNSHIYRMCSDCINQLRLNLKREIDKGKNNFASAEDFRKVQECFVVVAELESILKTNEF